MSSALTHALSRNRRLRGELVARAKAAAPAYNLTDGGGGSASLLSLAHGQDSILGPLTQTSQMTNHREQERHNTGWVFSCVRAIAQRAAGQPLRVARLLAGRAKAALRPRKEYLPKHLNSYQDRMEIIDDHPVLDAIERPNAVMTRWALTFVTLASLELTGKSHWWTYQGDEASPTPWTIMPLPSSWCRPLHEGDRIFSSWMVRPGNATQEIPVPAAEMAYIHYPDPSNPLGATCPLQAIARAVVADEAIGEAQRRSFSNGIWGGYAVTVAKNLDADGRATGPRPKLNKAQRGQIIAAILQAYRGVLNFDQPIILDGLIESITKLSNSPREMDFMKSKTLTKEMISQGFGVNPIILGQVEGANRASSATADDHFCSTCVNPKLELISQILTAFLAPRFAQPGERLLLYYEPASAYDPDLEMARQKMLMGFSSMTINDLRQQVGLPPAPGGNIALMGVANSPYNLDVAYDFAAEDGTAGGNGGGDAGAGAGHAGGRTNPDAGVDSEGGVKDAPFRQPNLGNIIPRLW